MLRQPLRRFPGPWHTNFSHFSYSWSYLRGQQPFETLKLHKKYGPVVRVAPNQLSFSSAQAWKDIYGPRPGHQTFVKSTFYSGGNFADRAFSIVSERDPEKHREMRKHLSTVFSDRSLRDQEYLVSGVIDEFLIQLRRFGEGGMDLTKWFNLLTFDIIGELAFGKSFNGIAHAETHPWVANVVSSMGQASTSDFLSRFPFLGFWWIVLNPTWAKKLKEGSQKHEAYTLELVSR